MKFEDVEVARKKYYEKMRKIRMVVVIVFLIPTILLAALGSRSFVSILPAFTFGFFGLVIGLIIIAIATRAEGAAYQKAYKKYFIEQMMAEVFTDLNYDHEKGLPREILAKTEMVDLGDRYSSNDLTVAKYKDVDFMQADVHIQEEYTDSDGKVQTRTTFFGKFMLFEFPRKFDFRLVVLGKGAGAVALPHTVRAGKKFRKMETESTEFNRRFKIYAEDGMEMFYILDPAFMERIQAIGDANDGRVMFGFVDNKLLVGLNNGKDSFEAPNPRRPLDEEAEKSKNRADIKMITDFVDKLKLDRKLFKD